MNNKLLKVIVSAQDDASKKLKQISDSMKGAVDASEKFGATVAVAGAAMVAAGAYMVNAAGAGMRAKDTFDKLAVSLQGTTMNMEPLRRATLGLVSDTDIMQNSNKLMSMGLASNQQELEKMMNTAVRLGGAMGAGPQESMENFALMLANQSIPRLDTFGISSGKVRTRIEELMKANKDMTRETAFMTATMEEAEKSLGKLGEYIPTPTERFQQLVTKAQNLAGTLGEILMPLFESFVKILEDNAPAIEAFAKQVAEMAVAFMKNPEAMAILAGVIIGALVPAFVAAAGAIWSAVAPLLPFMAAGAAIAALAPTIKQAYDTNFMGMRDTIEQTKVKMVEFNDVIQQKTQETTAAVGQWWSSVSPVIMPIFEDIKDIATDAFNGLMAVAKNVFETQLKPVFASFGDTVSSTFGEAWGVIEEAGRTLVVWWNSIIKPTLSAIKQGWETDFGGIRTFVVTVFNAIGTVLSTFWQTALGIFKAGGQLIYGAMKAVLQLLRGQWGEAWETLKGAFSNAWNTIISTATNLLNRLLSIFGTSLDGINQAFTSGLQVVVGTIKNWWDATIAFFSGLPAKMTEFGANIMQGLADGITNAAGAAVNAAGQAASNVAGSVANFFGIRSPSRLMMEYGAYTMDGLAIGISDNKEKPISEMQKAMNEVRDKLNELKDTYTENNKAMKDTMTELATQHRDTFNGMQDDIKSSTDAIRGFQKEYQSMVSGQGTDFGEKFVNMEQQLGTAMNELSKARFNGSDADIGAAQSKVSMLQAEIEKAKAFYLGSKEDETNRIAEMEASLAEKQRAIAMTNDLERRAYMEVEMQDLLTKIEFARLNEESFAENQKIMAEGVARARVNANMSEMEKFMLSMQQKRVQEKQALDEKVRQEKEKLDVIIKGNLQEIEVLNRKMQEVKLRQDIMYAAHKDFMESTTKKTIEEVNKQIEFFNKLAEAARAAASAKMSAGVSASYGGARANGGPVEAGTAYTVGERGPEMFIPDQRGTIIPTSSTPTGGQTINVNINGGSFLGTPEQIGDAIFNQVRLNVRV